MFNSKLAKHKKLLLFNTILLSILLIGEAIFCLYVHKQNEQIVHLTQLSTKAPVNRENKLYFSVIPSKELKDGERNGVILNCIIVNTTKHDFTDWEIKFKIPEGTSILSNLNCKLIRSPDSYRIYLWISSTRSAYTFASISYILLSAVRIFSSYSLSSSVM